MIHPNEKRFQDFFANDAYVSLKNNVYNYVVRKWAVENNLMKESPRFVLEVGSGLSPMITSFDRVVFSDLSFEGVKNLRKQHPKGWHVVADCTQLPFRNDVFSHAVSSEVLEHVERDQDAIFEMARVMVRGGRLFVTFPHRKFYYWNDDRFVGHFRRYELAEMVSKLKSAGLQAAEVRKVLGPLEKLSMSTAIRVLPFLERHRRGILGAKWAFRWINFVYAHIIWLDAKIMPRSIAAVLLVMADKL